ncbi:MAG: EAL domain-containing protein [Eubacteriales bacterium]|nr:EAL domain-containing protein [Eubacteriales bacterium]
MIYYEDLPLAPDILKALSELQINYVFQPIFFPDGKTIYAHEALMRPLGSTVTELIEEYTEKGQLHILEVATFWGATQAYFLRGYKEKLSVNSFPCECFSESEAKAYIDYFGNEKSILMIEMLEYPVFSLDKSIRKKEVAEVGNSILALDDFGVGFNDMNKVKLLDPHVVKLDRSLLSGIDQNDDKKKNCKEMIDAMHDMGKLVVAEGVETKEEFDYLVSIGADLFQGYYLARPA